MTLRPIPTTLHRVLLITTAILLISSTNAFWILSKSSPTKHKPHTIKLPSSISACIINLNSLFTTKLNILNDLIDNKSLTRTKETIKYSQIYAKLTLSYQEGKCQPSKIMEFKAKNPKISANSCFRSMFSLTN